MRLGRLETYILLSLFLHLLILVAVPRLSPQHQSPPKIFEVVWVDPSSTKATQSKQVQKTAPRVKAPAAPAEFKPAQASKRAPKPSLDLSPAPLGARGGQLALGQGELRPEGPSSVRQGLGSLASSIVGLKPEAPTGTPDGLTSDQINRGQKRQREGGAPVVSKLQIKAQPAQHGRNLQAGQEKGTGAIEGEVSGRPVIFTPPTPSLNLERDVTVTLRFVVLADGSVEQIIPVKKTNPKLETLAIELLGQMRFKPISGKKPQSGIIHFKLRRQF